MFMPSTKEPDMTTIRQLTIDLAGGLAFAFTIYAVVLAWAVLG